jgi:LysM repeat protein
VFLRLVVVLAALSAPPASAQGEARAEGCGASVTVSIGDTLTNIAARCGVSPGALLDANPQIRDPDIVPLGMSLTIPGGREAAAEPALADPRPDVAGVPPVRVVAIGGALDARVRLFATNLPPGAEALIGGGVYPSAPLFFARSRVDATGVLSVELALPSWSLRTGAVHLVVETPIGGPMLRAAPYRVATVSP